MLSGMMHLISPEQQEMIRSETQAHGGGCNIIEARVVRLADVLADAGISHIDLLSIDTEGSELQVQGRAKFPSPTDPPVLNCKSRPFHTGLGFCPRFIPEDDGAHAVSQVLRYT